MDKLKSTYHNQGSGSKVQNLVQTMRKSISSGKFEVGQTLPSVNHLSQELNISRDTVFKAYRELKNQGLIESNPARGYYVNTATFNVFLLLDTYSPFKDTLYNSILENLSAEYKVDLAFHQHNHGIFDTLIKESAGKYNFYLVMNFNEEKISETLKLIDPRKLLIVDWGNFRDEKYAYVCQDFGEAPYQCFNQAVELFGRYNRLHYVQPNECMHPPATMNYFKRFCSENGFSFNFLQHVDHENVKRGDAYFVFRQKELVETIKICRKNNWKPGRDIGIVAYNNSPLYEIIEDGITTISTDFAEMGKKAAEFVTTRKTIQTIIPTKLNIRSSL